MAKSKASSRRSNTKLWGGGFREELDELAFEFSKSINLDARLYKEDIQGSLAHIDMLAAQGLLSKREAATLTQALHTVEKELEQGKFPFENGQEDIHLAIEKRLYDLVGSVAGKLHTARSRNDQVATDERLYLRRRIDELIACLTTLQTELVAKADKYFNAVMPGYTHLQRAQPVLLSHHLLAYCEMFERDKSRLQDCRVRLNVSPLGAAALAGTPHPIDRRRTARTLGFSDVLRNSMDAVSDRDYLIEFIAACSIIMMHLSRLAEEVVLWSSEEFRFITLSDAFTTGSSIMPQKKNPDMAELVRGKTGRVYGDLMNILTVMKGLPLAYNRDMQEDKFPMLDAADTTEACLRVFAAMLRSAVFNVEQMHRAVLQGYTTATDLADYLANKGVPFREAHEITAKIVQYASAQHLLLQDLDLKILKQFSPLFEDDVYAYLNPESSPARKRSEGSTAPKEVMAQLDFWKKMLSGKGNAAKRKA
ncbi:MAG: argininosuccinate lyase [Chloroherpetonaceae bacterium]|nr:argininosuccinate lyase [Chloroherpetonaceae bacterium]